MSADETFLVFPDPAPPELVRCLEFGDYHWEPAPEINVLKNPETVASWTGAVVATDTTPEAAWALCTVLRRGDVPTEPLLVLIAPSQLEDLDTRSELFDDFLITPFHPRELEARIKQLLWRAGRGKRPELVTYGPIELNLETYQAVVDGRALDLTYMEYELLRFLAATPGRVFTRETLLNRVWGYEYYGGARTVDVHVRRLRAKLGEEHSHLIQTIRSVGYKLGQSRWKDERSGP